MSGPLSGIRVIEIGSIGPGPFCAMMLADHGAEVIRVERPGGIQGGVELDTSTDILARSRRSITIDMKSDIAFVAINNNPCSIQKWSAKDNRHTIVLRNIKDNKVL